MKRATFVKAVGINLSFSIDTANNPHENVENLLKEAGLSLVELILIGKTTNKDKPFGGLVEAVVE